MSQNDQKESLWLERFPHLHLALNTPKGRGVVTSAPISAGTIIDVSPVLVLGIEENVQHIEQTQLFHYTYNWPVRPNGIDSDDLISKPATNQAIVFGLGSMFNHSTQHQNVVWKRDLDRKVIVYRALRDISVGEELCISYGDHLTFVDADGPRKDSIDQGDGSDVLRRIDVEDI